MESLLTGKAKHDFEDFLECRRDIWVLLGERFKDLPKPMQNAMIIEFFDSVGIYIETLKDCLFGFIAHDGDYKNPFDSVGGFNSRTEAIKNGIIKANEIFNNRK